MSIIPKHIAIIMDGSGRWAERRMLPRVAGHHRGVESARAVVKNCIELSIPVLTMFAFSSENWRRPPTEVKLLNQDVIRYNDLIVKMNGLAAKENKLNMKPMAEDT